MSDLIVEVDPREWGFSPDRLSRVATYFDRYVEDARLAGWLATVRRGGQLVWSAKGGHRDRENDLPVTDDTIWRIYSMTKPIVAVATMMLFEEGRFDLNSDVGRWIEELREPRVWSGVLPRTPRPFRPRDRYSYTTSSAIPAVSRTGFSTTIRSTRSIATRGTTFSSSPAPTSKKRCTTGARVHWSFNRERGGTIRSPSTCWVDSSKSGVDSRLTCS